MAEPDSKDFLAEIWKLIKFLVKLPVFLTKKAITYFKKEKKKKEKKAKQEKTKEKREEMTAEYEPFDVLEAQSGTFERFEKNLFASESKIGIIVGARGKGKTALGVKLLENMYAQTKKKCYAMGFKEKDMPSWIRVVENVEDIKSNAVVLIDEGGILFSSRKSMSEPNQVLSELILVARHKNLSIIFISQNSSNLDVNILRQADFLLLKPSSLLQLDFERKKIKEVYEDSKYGFEVFKSDKGLCYVYADEFQGFISNPLPSFWTTKISKAFKNKKKEDPVEEEKSTND